MNQLTISSLKNQAEKFCRSHKANFSKKDGKSIGTYIEKKFHEFLKNNGYVYKYSLSDGLDFPELEVDIKTTSSQHPQSSCPYTSEDEMLNGLGYGLLLFVYDKENLSSFFIPRHLTLDRSYNGMLKMTPALQWRIGYDLQKIRIMEEK